MLTLYGIPNCNTVKKARTWLDEHGIQFAFHDYKKQGISPEKIQEWYGKFPWERLVNKAGTTWKALSEDEKKRGVRCAVSCQIDGGKNLGDQTTIN